MFTNTEGKTIQVRVMESEAATASLLEEVLDKNFVATRLLARMVHQPMSLSLPDEFDAVSKEQLDLSHVGVWIDPIGKVENWAYFKLSFVSAID